MLRNKSIISFFIIFISLLSIQICSITINSPYFPNVLLAFLASTLYQHQSLAQSFIILLGIEFLSLLELNASGFSFIILTPLILYFGKTRTFLQLKLLTPVVFIFIYEAIYSLFVFATDFHIYDILNTSIKIITTYMLFLIMYFMLPRKSNQLDQF